MREWLTEARKKRGLTQVEVSRRIHVTPAAYFGYEHGHYAPKPATAKRIASVLGIDWTRFYDEPAP